MAITYTVRGYVQDAVAGTGLAGAVVNVFAHTDANGAGALLGVCPATDANGLFEVTGIAVQQVDVRIVSGGQTYWWKGFQSMSLGDVYIDKVIVGANGALLPNNVALSGTTTGGVSAPLVKINTDDNTVVSSPAAGKLIGLQDAAGNNLFLIGDTGDATLTGALTQSVTRAGNIPVLLMTGAITPNVTTSVIFNTIPQTFKHLQVRGQVRWGTATTASNTLFFRINTLATTIYGYVDTSGSLSTSAHGTAGRIAPVPADSVSGKWSAAFEATFYNYADTNLYKAANVFELGCLGTSYANIYTETTSNFVETTAAITRIDLADIVSLNTFGAGSCIELWGIP